MARGDAARGALVESAERLFAERGIEGVSLRDVSKAAGQRNNSAAQYHFDDRQGLVAAVYEHRMQHVDARRHAYLATHDHDVRGLVEATVIPLLDVVAETDGWYARFLARTRWDPIAWEVLQSLSTSTSFETVVRGLNRELAHLPRPIRRHRIDQLLTLVLGTLAGWEGGHRRLDRATLSAELVETAVSLLTAPTRHLQGASR